MPLAFRAFGRAQFEKGKSRVNEREQEAAIRIETVRKGRLVILFRLAFNL